METIKNLQDLTRMRRNQAPFNTYFKISDIFLADFVEVANPVILTEICEKCLYLTNHQFNLIYNAVESIDNYYNDALHEFIEMTLSYQIDHYDVDQLRTAIELIGSQDVSSFIETFDEEIFTELVADLDWEEITSNRLMDLDIPVEFFITHSQEIFRNNRCDIDNLGEYYEADEGLELLARLVR